jgi:hypothetical protein
MENKLRGRGTGQEHNGLIHVHLDLLESFDFHGRITEPRSSAALEFDNTGTHTWENFQHARMSGVVTSGTVSSSGSFINVIPLLELLPGFEIADPNGGSLGIDWSAPDPLTASRIPERSVNLSMGLADRFEGEIISRWGGSAYSTVTGGKNGIGTAEKPLKFYMVDKGFLADYPDVELGWYEAQNGVGKFDGYDNSTELGVINAPVYIDYIYQGKCRMGRGVVWEASGQDAGEYKYVQGFHIRHFLEMPESSYICRLRGLECFIGWDTPENPADGYVRHNTIEGTFASIHLQDGPNTLRNIVLMGSDYTDLPVFQVARAGEWGAGNAIGPIAVDGMTFRTTCYSRIRKPMISIDEGEITITDLVMDAPFTPQTAPFASLGQADAMAGLGPVVLNLVNHTLRTGARVEAAVGASNPSITFMIDGITQSLPWTAP